MISIYILVLTTSSIRVQIHTLIKFYEYKKAKILYFYNQKSEKLLIKSKNSTANAVLFFGGDGEI